MLYKIIGWNILKGGGKRDDLIIGNILKYNADIIVLSEFRNNKRGSKYQCSIVFIS